MFIYVHMCMFIWIYLSLYKYKLLRLLLLALISYLSSDCKQYLPHRGVVRICIKPVLGSVSITDENQPYEEIFCSWS